MTKKKRSRLILFSTACLSFALSFGAKGLCKYIIKFEDLYNLVQSSILYLRIFPICIVILIVLEFLIENRFYRGIKYFWYHWTIKRSLQKQLIDAGFSINRGNYIEVPKIIISFEKKFSKGKLKIRNNLRLDKKLDDVVMSAALKRFVVETHWPTDDMNYYIYAIIDGSVSFKMTFENFNEFLEYNRNVDSYEFFLDKRSVVKLQHTLIVGQTGSGKTYELYNLILQFLKKKIKCNLFFADPKGSSLSVLGLKVSKNRTAITMEGIIELLEEFNVRMEERKVELSELLNTRLDADYSDFFLEPNIFVFDEYAAFASVISSQDKKTKDRVKKLLYQVILEGRQLGFFLFIIMQKSDATLIDTALRDNIPLKILLGNSEKQTQITAFGAGVDIPNRHYKSGEGAVELFLDVVRDNLNDSEPNVDCNAWLQRNKVDYLMSYPDFYDYLVQSIIIIDS